MKNLLRSGRDSILSSISKGGNQAVLIPFSAFSLFIGELLLPTAHFVVVVDVAALALSLCVYGSLAGVWAFGRQRISAVLVIAMIAHAHCVQGKLLMRTACNRSFFASRFSHRSNFPLVN